MEEKGQTSGKMGPVKAVMSDKTCSWTLRRSLRFSFTDQTVEGGGGGEGPSMSEQN